MAQILAFSGKKQSGKNTLCNFLHGYQLKSFGVIDAFDITTDGELIVDTLTIDEQGKEKRGKGGIDITRTDIEFAIWAMDNVWPFVKHYAFATTLKEIAIELFNIDRELMYGSEEQKNTLIQYKWENMPVKVKNKTGQMTARDFIQYFGTDICRKILPDIWINKTIKDVQTEESKLAIVTDARFINEVEAVKIAGGKVIRLTRGAAGLDTHESELALDNYDKFDAVIDTENLSIHESCVKLLEILDEWGWLSKELIVNVNQHQSGKRQAVTSIK